MVNKILITGNMGYVGPVLTKALRKCSNNLEIIGFDSGFFAHCLTNKQYHPEIFINKQILGDIRNFPESLLNGVDTVIHLCAISNDPMGNQFEKETLDINHKSSIKLAQLCYKLGIKRFVFASSCSIYGFSDKGPRKENDELNPLTAYAKSKVSTEEELSNISDKKNNQTKFTSLRFSTACGMSNRLRLDLVLNDFVASALSQRKIIVLSDGSPWRPLIDVEDMATAIIWAITERNSIKESHLSVNVGSNDRNYQVSELAECVSKIIKGTTVEINKDALPDKRSYKVDFSLYKEIAPNHQPSVSLEESINRIYDGLGLLNFSDKDFRVSNFMRLKVLESHIKDGRLNNALNWKV